jgi:hypothetical protein
LGILYLYLSLKTLHNH